MSPKPKNVPSRLGPPPQLTQLHRSRIPMIKQQQKFQPKMREIMAKQAKLIARWIHAHMTWKKILMTWMVILVASKMILLMLTYQFFTLTALISLQIFHGVWTIAFFCLNVIESRAILPNASCLLAGYLPATTVLHILLIPNDYPLEFIITDAVGTFLAIITMFLLLRMECTEILHEAEYMYDHQHSDTTSESGLSSTSSGSGRSSRSTRSNGMEIQTPNGKRIIGNPTGPTIITVSGVGSANHPYDSMLFNSIDEPLEASMTRNLHHNSSAMMGGHNSHNNNNNTQINNNLGHVLFDEAVDLEPIDFEHFVDEPDLNRNQSERMFQVTLGSSPPTRGR